jgi:hypothetical protein
MEGQQKITSLLHTNFILSCAIENNLKNKLNQGKLKTYYNLIPYNGLFFYLMDA